MRGRAKGEAERIVLVAHQTEAMARQKILRSPEHYLAPKPSSRGPEAVAAMFRRMSRRGLVTARPIPPEEIKTKWPGRPSDS